MSEARALRIIAAQMDDFHSYRTDELGLEAACLRDAATRIEALQEALRRIIAVADRDTNDFRFARNALKGKQDD